MNLQDIKTQLEALNKAVTEMETAKAEFTFTRQQMEKFVSHMATTLVDAISTSIDHEFELDEDTIEVEINNNYGRDFTVDLNIDQREIKQNIKNIIESSYDDSGIMEEVMNCYPAIVESIVENDPVPFQD